MKMRFSVFLAFAGFVMVTSVGALTTFGKTPTNSNPHSPPPPTPVGKARECKAASDCAGIEYTSCMADGRDGKLRCLCGDRSPPENGKCKDQRKAIRSVCDDHSECMEGAHCVVMKNATVDGNNDQKRCYCKEDYVEENLSCSGCFPVLRISSMVLAATLISGKLIVA